MAMATATRRRHYCDPLRPYKRCALWRGLHLRDHVYSGTGGEAAGSGADAACVVSPSPRTEVELLRDLLASKDAELKALIARDRQANATAVTRARLDQMQKESGMRGDGVTGIIVAGVAGDKARLGPVATSALIQRWWRAVRYHGHHAPFCDRALLSVYWRSAMRQFSQRRRHGRQIALLLARGVVRDVVEAAIGTAASRANPLSKVLRKAEMTGKNGGSGGFRPPSAYHTSSSSSTTCVPQSFIMIHRSHDPPPPPPPPPPTDLRVPYITSLDGSLWLTLPKRCTARFFTLTHFGSCTRVSKPRRQGAALGSHDGDGPLCLTALGDAGCW